jgi:CRISPR/Cas system CSM-associated protein Csm2 small subunit
MANRNPMKAVEFVSVFTRLAKEGKSALEIGRVLGLKGDNQKVSQAVSVKASQLRKRLKESAVSAAKANGLDEAATATLIKTMANKLPRIKSKGRASEVSELVSAIDSVLAELDAPSDEVEDSEVVE